MAYGNDTETGGSHFLNTHLTVIGDDVGFQQRAFHHEEVHGHQETSAPMPDGLTPQDQAFWTLGTESQAYVAEEDDARRRVAQENGERRLAGKPLLKDPETPLTDEEKREIFVSKISNALYTKESGIDVKMRSGGRHLAVEEFVNAFGTIPGHEGDGNFLTGAHYKDVADIYGSTVPVDVSIAAIDPQQKGVKYDDLPAAKNGMARIESKNKDYIAFVTQKDGEDKAEVQIYRKTDSPDGTTYVSMADRALTTDNIRNSRSDIHFKDSAKPEADMSISISKKGIVYSNLNQVGPPPNLLAFGGDPGAVTSAQEFDITPIPGNVHILKFEDLPKPDAHTVRYYDNITRDVFYFEIDQQKQTVRNNKSFSYQEYPSINLRGYEEGYTDTDRSLDGFNNDVAKSSRYSLIGDDGMLHPLNGPPHLPPTTPRPPMVFPDMQGLASLNINQYNPRRGNYSAVAATARNGTDAMPPHNPETEFAFDSAQNGYSTINTAIHGGFNSFRDGGSTRQPVSEKMPHVDVATVDTDKIALPAAKLGRISL